MLDDPRPEELLAAVARLLREEIVPQLSGSTAFHARVAANAIDLVQRQIGAEERMDGEEKDRLAALLGQQGTTADLNRLLAARLREGAGEAELPGLTDHLWETTLAKIAVDQPRYASIDGARAVRAACNRQPVIPAAISRHPREGGDLSPNGAPPASAGDVGESHAPLSNPPSRE